VLSRKIVSHKKITSNTNISDFQREPFHIVVIKKMSESFFIVINILDKVNGEKYVFFDKKDRIF
jgi:hypothetical protein